MATIVKTCEECGGSGMLNDHCDTCNSFGWVDDPSDGGTMTCPDCDGESAESCDECEGVGSYEEEVE